MGKTGVSATSFGHSCFLGNSVGIYEHFVYLRKNREHEKSLLALLDVFFVRRLDDVPSRLLHFLWPEIISNYKDGVLRKYKYLSEINVNNIFLRVTKY